MQSSSYCRGNFWGWKVWGVRVGVRGWKMYCCVPRSALPIHFFRHFSCRMYRLATVHGVRDRQTDDIMILTAYLLHAVWLTKLQWSGRLNTIPEVCKACLKSAGAGHLAGTTTFSPCTCLILDPNYQPQNMINLHTSHGLCNHTTLQNI